MLTAKDFDVVGITCPVCQRPAKVYSRKGHNYLRCTWEDCRLNRNMVVPSIESFYGHIEKLEKDDFSQPYRGARMKAETTEAKDPTQCALRKG